MKLSPEKDTFMVDLISGCISFNQVFGNMNKKHTGKNDEIYVEHILTAVQ